MDRLNSKIIKVIAEGLYTFYHEKELRTADDFQQHRQNVQIEYHGNVVFHARVNALAGKIIALITERGMKNEKSCL